MTSMPDAETCLFLALEKCLESIIATNIRCESFILLKTTKIYNKLLKTMPDLLLENDFLLQKHLLERGFCSSLMRNSDNRFEYLQGLTILIVTPIFFSSYAMLSLNLPMPIYLA